MDGNDMLSLAQATGATDVVMDVVKTGGSIIAASVAAGGIPAGVGATLGTIVGGTVAIVTSPAVLTCGAIIGGVALLSKLFD